MHLLLTLIWISGIFLYFMCLFNSSELEAGDPLTTGILFGCAEFFGTAVSERFLVLVPDHIALKVLTPIVLLLSTLLKLPDIDTVVMYFVLIVQIISIGGAFNIIVTVQETRTPASLQAISLEMNLCIAQFMTSTVPVLAKAAEPVPTAVYWVCCIALFIGIAIIGPSPKGASKPRHSLIHSLEQSLVTMLIKDATAGEVTNLSLVDGSVLRIDGSKFQKKIVNQW